MNLTYTYEIISVDQSTRCMEVVYTSEGNPTLHINARLPYKNETVESVVKMYAPIQYWHDLKAEVLPVSVGQVGTITTALLTEKTTAQVVIQQRNLMLAESDWTQLSDVPLTAEQKAEWATYRQQLRDLTAQPGFPDNINWVFAPDIQLTVV